MKHDCFAIYESVSENNSVETQCKLLTEMVCKDGKCKFYKTHEAYKICLAKWGGLKSEKV